MKKSLPAILSLAMAFSMFSSVAFGAEGEGDADAAKTSANFSDLKDLDAATKAKFDALISAGVFDGVKEGTFGLKEKMNRAQFAKVAALIFGLKVDSSLKTSSFTDVKADDPANGYALPYIEAVKAAGITDGYAPGQFNPAGEVTKEQLATFLIRGLKKDKDAQATPGVADKTVSDWAKGYVALAIQLKIMSSGADGTFGGTSAATRDMLVTSAYEAQNQYKNLNKPAKASVTEAKPTGVYTVQVKLDREVDTKKAKLTLKKGSADIETTVKWADDKNSATLTLTDVRISAGEYSVTLSGLDAKDLDKTVAKFTAEDEVLKSIDFLSANDTVAKASKVILKLAAKNQYGEKASFSAGGYDVYTSGAQDAKITKNDDGTLLLSMRTDVEGLSPGATVIPVTVVNNDQHVTVSKSFKLGVAPILTKLELGDVQYSNETEKAINAKGDYATLELNLYDQYGGNISYDSNMKDIFGDPNTDWEKSVNVIWNDYIGSTSSGATIIGKTVEDNGNNIPRLKLSLNENVDKSGEYTFTVTTQAATATSKLKIQSSKIATKVELGDFNDVIANGDQDVYIPLVAYDALGNQLSVDDLTSDANRDRIQISVSGAGNKDEGWDGKITNSGAHRGSVHIRKVSAPAKSSVAVTAVIASPNATSTATRTYTVSDTRYPDRIKEVEVPAKEYYPNASSSFKFQVYDQYGKSMNYNLPVSKDGKNVTYSVYVGFTADSSNYFTVTKDDDSQEGTPIVSKSAAKEFNHADEWNENSFKTINDGLRVVAAEGAAADAQARLRFEIRKSENGGAQQTMSSVEKSLKIVSENADLNYAIADLGTMHNTRDSGLSTYYPPVLPDINGKTIASATLYNMLGGHQQKQKVSDTLYSAVYSPFNKEIKMNVTTASGDKVAVPKNFVKRATSSDQISAFVGRDPKDDKWYVFGYKTGSSTISVNYENRKGENKVATATVTLKSERKKLIDVVARNKKIQVEGVLAGSSDKYRAYNVADAYIGEVSNGLMNLQVTDQYGTYDGTVVNDYNHIFGLQFTADHVVLKGAAMGDERDIVEVVQVGESQGSTASQVANVYKVKIGSNVKQFDLSATSTNGLSATTEVTVK
ncbi:hypothetical protein PAESOLCIP111_03750 [Paenibacillus solanacearum]|uniref:SLH domain-containing protein n=1 Tax=Paenibacillus solanacearum TaxID=2048548 RepID=A0A916K6W3_9BACL|nr:S-layer homology domain-containing protein [Paenibacillus solanacearum]CAG7636432.1 hypothetical protein PAESOLCIP111_03750 [Paenibacillus solanacearum]